MYGEFVFLYAVSNLQRSRMQTTGKSMINTTTTKRKQRRKKNKKKKRKQKKEEKKEKGLENTQRVQTSAKTEK